MKEEHVVQSIAEMLVDFCMPRECLADALIYAQEVYDVEVRPMLRDVWADGHRSHASDPNPYEEELTGVEKDGIVET